MPLRWHGHACAYVHPGTHAPTLTRARIRLRSHTHTHPWHSLMQWDGACAHYVMVSKFQWKPFWLATQRDPQNDWTATQNRVNNDVFAQAPLVLWRHWMHLSYMRPVTSENQFHCTRLCTHTHAHFSLRCACCCLLEVSPVSLVVLAIRLTLFFIVTHTQRVQGFRWGIELVVKSPCTKSLKFFHLNMLLSRVWFFSETKLTAVSFLVVIIMLDECSFFHCVATQYFACLFHLMTIMLLCNSFQKRW